MPAVFAANGGAARTRHALVAGAVANVAKIRAARALQKIAAHCGLVAHLRARGVQQCLRDHGKLLDHDGMRDRKSTRLNSSHLVISYAVFCLKKKTSRLS